MAESVHKLLRFGVYEMNLDTQELRNAGTLVKLSPQPFALLATLARHAGQIVAREDIKKQLWGQDTYVDFDQGVNKCINQIRHVLNDNAERPLYIETLPRKGYRFLAQVQSKTVPASKRVVVNLPGPRLSVRDRLFVEMYLTVGELEKIPEYSAAFTLEQCRAIWARPKIRAQCDRYWEIADLENTFVRVRSKSLKPYLLAAGIVESIENAPPGSREKLKALMQGYVLLGLLKLRFREG